MFWGALWAPKNPGPGAAATPPGSGPGALDSQQPRSTFIFGVSSSRSLAFSVNRDDTSGRSRHLLEGTVGDV